MSRFGLSAVLAAFTLLVFATADLDDVPPVVIFLLLLVPAVALALAYDPATDTLVRARRWPGWRDVGLILVCLPIAILSFVGTVEMVPALYRGRGSDAARSIADQVEWGLSLCNILLPLVPLLATAFAPRHPPGTRPPLWPLVAGLATTLLAWLGGAGVWSATVRPLLGDAVADPDVVLSSPTVFAMGALVLGIAAQFWWRAVRDRGAARFDDAGMFRVVIVGAALATGVGLALVAALVVSLPPSVAVNRAPWLAGLQVLPLTVVWMVTLWRISRVTPASRYPTLAAVAAIAVLLLTIPLSFAPAVGLAGAREWAELLVLITTPVVIAACAVVLLVVPRMIAFLLSRSPSVPAASAAPG